METANDSASQSGLAAALDRLWTRFLPEIRDRVSILESAAAALASDMLDASQKEAAGSAAHKLAGVLGTFNLARGTALAREAESFYSSENNPDPACANRLAVLAAELRSMVESRQ